MGNTTCLLITILFKQQLLKCALKVNKDQVASDALNYPMEQDSRETLHKLLPEHVRSCGPIVAVESIFNIQIID